MLEDSPEVQEFSAFKILEDTHGITGYYCVIAPEA